MIDFYRILSQFFFYLTKLTCFRFDFLTKYKLKKLMRKKMKKILILFISFFMFASSAVANSGNLVIVTSFPKDLSGKFKAAFETKYPNITVEVVGKKAL